MIDWMSKQDAWARDALRRHAASPKFNISLADKEEILARVRQAATAADEELEAKTEILECVPIAAEDLKFPDSQAETPILYSLGPIANVGRLAPNQTLSFALNGITLVYGENGSGKSGYCRVAKKICRSLSADELIGNVFEEGSKPPAEVVIRYRPPNLSEAESPIEETWKDGSPPPETLRHISVFDSANAQLYISQNNKIEYLPSEVALLESHGAHRDEMAEIFLAERKQLEAKTKTALPSGYSPSTTAGGLVKRVDIKSKSLPKPSELVAAAAWTDAHQAELTQLEKEIAQDPIELAARLERSIKTLKSYKASIDEILSVIGEVNVAAVEALRSELQKAAAASSAVAAGAFSSEPIPGVGSDAWQTMYRLAEEFIIGAGYEDGLPADPSSPCALCQQPLSDEASNRMLRFRAFMTGELTKAAAVAKANWETAVKRVKTLSLPTELEIESQLAEYASISAERLGYANAFIGYLASSRIIHQALLEAIETGDTLLWEEIDTKWIDAELAALAQEATALRDASSAASKKASNQAKLIELKDRQRLRDDFETVVARLTDLRAIAISKHCSSLVGTMQLSLQITAVRRQLLADGLGNRIQEEINALDLGHLPFSVQDMSREGQSYFGVGLKSAVEERNDRVLSEGEQRALALACFLGEQSPKGKYGIVIDDPVSSLDHVRIRRVAERLAMEASKGKQVIVFTHNLLFYNEVADAAARLQVPLVKRVVTKSQSLGFGLISDDDEPWMVKKVTLRINHLKKKFKDNLESEVDFDTDDYRQKVKDFYTDLRETWERLVEEVLLGKVIERLNSEVKTQSLKLVEVTDADHHTVFWNMKRASENSGHDKATNKTLQLPKPADIKSDLEKLETYRGLLAQRQKEVETRRKSAEDAPKAVVG